MKKNLLLRSTWLFIAISILHFTSYSQNTQNRYSSSPVRKDTIINPGTLKTPKFNETICTQANLRTTTITDNVDVRVFPSEHPQSEVHISLDRANPNHLIASANTYIYGPSNGYHQGYYYSLDGGAIWQGDDILQNTYGGELGDPSTAYSADGRAYISTARPAGGYYLQSSTNGGVTWSNLNIPLEQIGFDKEMIVADNEGSSPYANRYYIAWTHFITSSNLTVEFQRSLDNGNTFSTPLLLKNGKGSGANVQTGPNGEVYVCWADYNSSAEENPVGLGFTKSLDGGSTFSNFIRVFDYAGSGGINADLNNTDYRAFPAMAVDKSNGPHRGRIYVTYPTKENGNGKLIVQVRYSDNQGTTWSAPTTVNIPAGRQNWMPWIAVDNCTGEVWVVYYSFDTASGFETNTYVALSTDGGLTWDNQKVSDVSHITAPIDNTLFRAGYCGDYIGITAHGGRANPIWHDNRNGTWQLYTSAVSSTSINATISGSTYLCTSNTYTINNVPIGYSVQSWETIPSNIATVASFSGNTATVARNQSGIFTLIANIQKCGANYPIYMQNISTDPGTLPTNMSISGGDIVCTTSNPYTINNLPPTAIVQWQASPQGIVTINSPNSQQTTLNKYTDGTIVLTATISNPCSGQQLLISKQQIIVGVPAWNQLSIGGVTDNQIVCPNVPVTLAIGVNPGLGYSRCSLLNAEWYSSMNGTVINNNSGNGTCPNENNVGVTMVFPRPSYTTTAYIEARVQNSCGWSDWFPKPMLRLQVNPNSTNCGGGGKGLLTVSPNPSASEITVQASETFSFTQIKIYDRLGIVRKKIAFPKGTKKALINISELSTDVYQIQAFNGKEWQTISFTKQ